MSKPNIQLIICVETNKKAATDSRYISGIIKAFYEMGENKLTFVYLGGKFNFNHPKIIKEIKTNIKEYQLTNNGQSFVLYVSDKDRNTADYRDNQYVKNITEFCKENGYELIWFVKTIEDVIWGSKVKNADKVKKSIQFIKTNQIKNVHEKNLSALQNVNSRPKSNVLTVLNHYAQIQKK